MRAINKKYIISIIISVLLFNLYLIETEKKSVCVVSYEFRNINNSELFDLITYPETVSKWFRWIKHVRPADQTPLNIGKLYQIYYDSKPVIFKVVSYKPHTLIALESESLLKPRVELRTFFISKRKSRLMISISFQRTSALFQYSMGPFLQHISKKALINSIKHIKEMLKNRSDICHVTRTKRIC